MSRPLTRFSTAPKYQKKIPKKEEPECITISSDDDEIDTEYVQDSRPQRTMPLRSQSQRQSSQSYSTPKPAAATAAATPRQTPSMSTRLSSAKEPTRVPHLYSTQTRVSTPPLYQKRTSIVGSTAASASSSHGISTRSNYFPFVKVNPPQQQRQAPLPGTNSINHKGVNANANVRVRHSTGGVGLGVPRSQPRAIVIGDTDDEVDEDKSETASESTNTDVMKVDKACGPDGAEDRLKTRTELLFGRTPVTIPLRRTSEWGDKLKLRSKPRLEQGPLCKSLFNGSGPTHQNGDIFAHGALSLTRSRSSSMVSTGSNDNGDSTKAVGSRGSSSSFSISSTTGTEGRQGSGFSTPKSPISMSTENDPKFFQDVQILCEKIVSPPQRRDWHAVNSLELEISQVQARNKGWLVQL